MFRFTPLLVMKSFFCETKPNEKTASRWLASRYENVRLRDTTKRSQISQSESDPSPKPDQIRLNPTRSDLVGLGPNEQCHYDTPQNENGQLKATDETPMHTERKSGSVTPRRQGAKGKPFCGFAALREPPVPQPATKACLTRLGGASESLDRDIS